LKTQYNQNVVFDTFELKTPQINNANFFEDLFNVKSTNNKRIYSDNLVGYQNYLKNKKNV
jgi:hypothetical protein